jgi:hypothetical protein
VHDVPAGVGCPSEQPCKSQSEQSVAQSSDPNAEASEASNGTGCFAGWFEHELHAAALIKPEPINTVKKMID